MVIKVNDIDLRVANLFTKGYNKEYYIREVEKLLQVSSRTALVTLAKLEKTGILASRIRGKIKTYCIKKSGISKEYFLLTEHYKTIQFLAKNLLIKEVLEKSDDLFEGMVIIFGSYAKGIQKESSDLDVFLTGRYNEKEIKKIGHTYGIEINIKDYPLTIFKKGIHEDILLKEIVENHIIIKGTEMFIEVVVLWTK